MVKPAGGEVITPDLILLARAASSETSSTPSAKLTSKTRWSSCWGASSIIAPRGGSRIRTEQIIANLDRTVAASIVS